VSRTRQLLLALLSASALAGIAVAVPAGASGQARHPLIGIADENIALFSDPRFLSLGIKEVRFYVSWDVLSHAYRDHYRRKILAAWLATARARGLTPLITFEHSYLHGRVWRLPSVANFSKAFLAFRKRWPWVKEFATWNEANYFGEPTAGYPRRTAQYYLALRRDCPSCTILAADLLDVPRTEAVPMVQWVHAFIGYTHRQPGYWGINNYFGANRFETATTEALLRAVTGKVWFAETGGIVKRVNATHVHFAQGERHAAKVDRFIFHRLAKLSRRIQRVYLYEWKAVSPHDTWDSALISWNDSVRPAYNVLANTLDAWGVKPNCALSLVPPACKGFTGATGATG
jgi:hypothetical protein